MRKSTKILLAAACFGYTFACAGADGLGANSIKMEDSTEFDGSTFSKVDITFNEGKVNINSSDGKGTSACFVKRRFSPGCELKMEVVSNVLYIKAKRKTKDCSCYIEFDISIPSRTHVNVAAGACIATIKDIKGDVSGAVGSGKFTLLAPLSSLDIALGNGDVFARGIFGNSKIATGTGGIDISYASTPKRKEICNIVLEVGTGSIKLALPEKAKVIHTFNGPPLVTSFTSAFPLDDSELIPDYDVSMDLALGNAFLTKTNPSKKELCPF